jgi:hypothetical protein
VVFFFPPFFVPLFQTDPELRPHRLTHKVRTEVSIHQYGLVVVVHTRTTTHGPTDSPLRKVDLVILEAKAEAPLGTALHLETRKDAYVLHLERMLVCYVLCTAR